jgi:hypothetical protein
MPDRAAPRLTAHRLRDCDFQQRCYSNAANSKAFIDLPISPT